MPILSLIIDIQALSIVQQGDCLVEIIICSSVEMLRNSYSFTHANPQELTNNKEKSTPFCVEQSSEHIGIITNM